MQKLDAVSQHRYSQLRFFIGETQSPLIVRPVEPETCISLIKRCTSLNSLKSVHASMLRSHLHLNLHFLTDLIAKYASLSSTSHAYILFSLSRSSDVFLSNVMIRGFVDNAQYRRSLSLYTRMRKMGILPDNFTFPFVLKACGCLGELKTGTLIHRDILERGLDSDVYVGNALVAMYGKCQSVGTAKQVFDKMCERNIVSWSTMIGAYAQSGCHEDGLGLFWQMLNEGIRPNRGTVLNAMACVHKEHEADAVCKAVVNNRLDMDRSVQNTAMVMYARCGKIDIARSFFDRILDKDLVSLASMIEAYAKAEMPLEGLKLFRELLYSQPFPDSITFLSVIRACSELGSFLQACTMHASIARRLVGSHMAIDTCIVDLYVKCGNLEYARKVFDQMLEKNLIAWSTMISGYGMHGRGREALCLFDQMKFCVKPDHIVFVSVLCACSHAGLLNEGQECFDSMSRDFGITPRHEHYACMVDLLGRAGCLDEAQDIIDRMPIKPDAGVWGALLGACRIHLDVVRAEKAAKFLFQLEPENAGRYVLLSNIYASSGRKKDADQIRDLMEKRGVRKISGHTIIEIKNRIYTFVAGDRSHSQANMIYSELDKLMDRIRLEGYKPDLNFVFHDVEEEMKERMLYVHSEKLAIVFGLLNLGPGCVIRIRKNLRVCGDCHTATKFISKVTEREIIVRDAHRFHHFKSGSCSCQDYW